MERSGSNITKFLIFSQKNNFLRFSQKKAFLIFPKTEPCNFHPKLQKAKKNPSKTEFSSPNTKKIPIFSYISGNGTFQL